VRIAVVHNLRAGGAARRLSGMVAALHARPEVTLRQFTLSGAVDVTHVLPEPDLPDAAGRRELTGVRHTPVRHATVRHGPVADAAPRWLRPPLRYTDFIRLERAWRALAGVVEDWRPDAVFVNPCGLSHAAPAALRWLAAPSVLYCDEPRRVDYERAARSSTNPATRTLYGPLRAAMRRSDRGAVSSASVIATNSAFTAAAIRVAYRRSARVVAPGVADVFTPTPSAARRSHLLSVGALIPAKGHELAVRAAGLSGLRLPVVVVAPRPDEAQERRLRRAADEVGVELVVRIGVPDAELVELYRHAYATLYLARAEPLGLVSLESQACGTPVIVSAEGGLAGTVDEGVTGFRVARDATAAAGRLADMAAGDRQRWMSAACAATPAVRQSGAALAILALLDEVSRTRGVAAP
jgi:glycosyltransferase involved in cell wall biosynthesis